MKPEGLAKIGVVFFIQPFWAFWSSIIMALLAIDNINSSFQGGHGEEVVFLFDKTKIVLQYFLLGTCSIYIVQNIIMIAGFFPDKYRFFNKEYFRNIANLKNEHINRYSDNQTDMKFSTIGLLVSVVIFSSNYYFNYLPRNTSIWIVFFVFGRIDYWYNSRNIILNKY